MLTLKIPHERNENNENRGKGSPHHVMKLKLYELNSNEKTLDVLTYLMRKWDNV